MNVLNFRFPSLISTRRAGRSDLDTRTLAERIGYSVDERLLITNCDDLGSSRSANRAIERALRYGVASSATLMVPCPWAEIAANDCRDFDIGVHLTLNSEYPAYRWASLTGGTTLHDKDGYLPKTTQEVWARADLTEVELECRAQIDRAHEWGIDVTHLDSHMDVMQLDKHYFGLYMGLAAHYRLPLRLRRSSLTWPFSRMSRSMLDRTGIVTTDRFVAPPWGEPVRPALTNCIKRLPRGVTEIVLHPVDDSDELRSYDTENAAIRAADSVCLGDETVRSLIAASDVTLIGFKPLREAMRSVPVRGKPQ